MTPIPASAGFTTAQIAQLKNHGQNRVISYLNVGSCETFRTYWRTVPQGFQPAHLFALSSYSGYPDEHWMDVGNPQYQNLIVNFVAPRLAAQGADGFFLDNMEIVEHGPRDKNGPCSPACRQGGLDLVRKLRDRFPQLLIVMQNTTSDITRLGKTGGLPFPSLLDGISHEEVYKPQHDSDAEAELIAWRDMKLRPGGRPFWIGTEDYVGGSSHTADAQAAYAASRKQNFSPYVADDSGKQQTVFYWPF